jgi:hypothetical protein
VLNAMEVSRHVAIAGRVTDTVTKKPVAGAAVSITEMPVALKSRLAIKSMQYGPRWEAMPERPDRTRTAADGLFYFLDLPDGKYTIAALLTSSGKRYGSARATVTVARDAKGTVKISFLEIGLPPTTVQGKVTGTGHRGGVVMAEIRVKGSGERAFSDAQGEYVLAGVEPGKRTVQVHVQGYRPASKLVSITEPGAVELLNFNLVREAG